MSWEYNVLFGDWVRLSSIGFPTWELIDRNTPHAVSFTFYHTKKIRSREIASMWDDLAKHNFFYRDWVDDGYPLIRSGNMYNSTFFFQRKSEAVRFHETYGGRGNWDIVDAVFEGDENEG